MKQKLIRAGVITGLYIIGVALLGIVSRVTWEILKFSFNLL